eukprot:8326815-Karenia_brevis.AAC.1
MKSLSRRCSHRHKHVALSGSVFTGGKWQSRTSLAAAYTVELCSELARVFESVAPDNAYGTREGFLEKWHAELRLAAPKCHQARFKAAIDSSIDQGS